VILLDVDQFLLSAVLLVEQLGVGVVHEAVALRSHEYPGDLDVLHLLDQLEVIEVYVALQRTLQEVD
jgi:hypothetical protein